jgi:hypothetical protein
VWVREGVVVKEGEGEGEGEGGRECGIVSYQKSQILQVDVWHVDSVNFIHRKSENVAFSFHFI